MKQCLCFSWKGLGSCANMSGTTKIVTTHVHPVEAIEQFVWEMRKEYPFFNCKIGDNVTITPSRVPPLWRRLLAKWRAGIHFGYLNTRDRDVIIVEVTK